MLRDFDVPKTPIDPYLLKRWDRQINYFALFEREGFNARKAQEKLKNSTVAVVGIGAGGSSLISLLSAAGIGNIVGVDFDTVEEVNLPSQIFFKESDIGDLKVKAIKKHITSFNSSVNCEFYNKRVESTEDVYEIIKGADFVFDAIDEPLYYSALWVTRACLKANIPYVSIGSSDKASRVGPMVIPGKTPCYECLGLLPIDKFFYEHKYDAAIMGANVLMVASIAVHEMIKLLTGFATPSVLGKTLHINTEKMAFDYIEHAIKPDCICHSLITYEHA